MCIEKARSKKEDSQGPLSPSALVKKPKKSKIKSTSISPAHKHSDSEQNNIDLQKLIKQRDELSRDIKKIKKDELDKEDLKITKNEIRKLDKLEEKLRGRKLGRRSSGDKGGSRKRTPTPEGRTQFIAMYGQDLWDEHYRYQEHRWLKYREIPKKPFDRYEMRVGHRSSSSKDSASEVFEFELNFHLSFLDLSCQRGYHCSKRTRKAK